MFFKSLIALALLAVPGIAKAETAAPAGIRTIAVVAPERGAPLNVNFWYPAGPGGVPVLVGGNAVFEGVAARKGAPPARGALPLILLSHGGLRAAPDLDAWIAARLAARGFMVAAPQSPGPGSLKARDALVEIWLRPADLSATLTALGRDPGLSGKIDLHRIGVLGFHLGGTSALTLAGARIDSQVFARSCDDGGWGLDCAWFRKSGVDLHQVDAAKIGRSNHDPRIAAAVAIDPEYAAAFTAASLAAVQVPTHVVNLGGPGEVLPGMDATTLAKMIPGIRYDSLAAATRFDAFGLCKPEGRATLRDEGDDERLCSDGVRPRAEIHAQLADMIAAAFDRSWRIRL